MDPIPIGTGDDDTGNVTESGHNDNHEGPDGVGKTHKGLDNPGHDHKGPGGTAPGTGLPVFLMKRIPPKRMMH